MKNRTKTAIIIGCVLFTIITIFILWTNGGFCIVDRQTSPNGKITTTVYSQNISELFPQNDGFTIKTSGDFKETRISTDGSKFEQLWWSPDSNYNVISTVYRSNRILELVSNIDNSSTNLSILINMSMSEHNEFTEFMTDEADWETLQLTFVQWKEEQGSMVVNFTFNDYTGSRQTGKLDFNCETGIISSIDFD